MADKYDALAALLKDANAKFALSSATRMKAKPEQLRAALLPYFADGERLYRLPKNLLANMAQKESSFRPEIVWGKKRSPAGAVGLMQIMPGAHPGINAIDPIEAAYYAGKHIRELIDRFDADKKKQADSIVAAVASYNWGRGNVLKKGLRNAPAETRDYVRKILGVIV